MGNIGKNLRVLDVLPTQHEDNRTTDQTSEPATVGEATEAADD